MHDDKRANRLNVKSTLKFKPYSINVKDEFSTATHAIKIRL